MGIAFSPGCECCNPCDVCDGDSFSKLQVDLNGFVQNGFCNSLGSLPGNGCPQLNGSFGTVPISFGHGHCIWQFTTGMFCPGFTFQNGILIQPNLIDLGGGTSKLQVIVFNNAGGIISAYRKDFAVRPDCSSWNNLDVPYDSSVAVTGWCDDLPNTTCKVTAIP